MKILITNDDGISATGLETLASVAREFAEVFVVAPKHQYSGCGHQITFGDLVHTEEVEKNKFWVDGTPADCVRIGLTNLVGPVDWVIAGVNEGSNLGNDVYMSGTVAAAREAAWQAHPAIALSQYHLPDAQHDWNWTRRLGCHVLEKLLQEKPQKFRFWNVNLPAPNGQPELIPAMRFCDLDPTPIQAEYRCDGRAFLVTNDYHARPRIDGHDVDVCFNGEISLTLV